MRDIIIDEVELSIVANTIQRDVDVLLEVMREYIQVLQNLQNNGIKDQAICSQLSSIASEVSFCAEQLSTNITPLGGTVQKAISRVVKADNFRFPNTSLLSMIDQIISSF